MLLAADAEGVLAAAVKHLGKDRIPGERSAVGPDCLLGNLKEADALNPRGSAREVAVNEALLESQNLVNLRAGVGHVGRDAHLRHDLAEHEADSLDVVLLIGCEELCVAARHGAEGLDCKPGMDCLCAVGGKKRELVGLAGGAGLDNESGCGAEAVIYQVLMNSGGCKERRNRKALAAYMAVGDDEDVGAALYGVLCLSLEGGKARLDAGTAPLYGVSDVELVGSEPAAGLLGDVPDDVHLGMAQDRLLDLDSYRRVQVEAVEQVGLRSDEGDERHDHVLADRVDRRVGDLREELAEVLVERLVLLRENRKGRIVAHRADRLVAFPRHGGHDELDVFLGVAEHLLELEQGLGEYRLCVAAALEVGEADSDLVNPLAVGLRVGKLHLDLLIADDAALIEIDEEHLARLKTPAAADVRLGDGKDAGLGGHDDGVILGDEVAGRTKAISVERCADLAAVGEGDCRRSVPRLHDGGMVLVEGLQHGIHGGVLLPRLRNHHHDCLGKGIACHYEKLESVVEGGGV